jgi:hypothetical protein
MSKLKLSLDDSDERSENFILGIVSSSSHLKFVDTLNKTGHFDFCRTNDLAAESKSEAEYFIYFTYFDNETETDFKLIKNRGSNGLVGKELKGMDYLLMIQTENTDLIQSLKEVLNNLRIVQAVALISEKQLSERTKRILPF